MKHIFAVFTGLISQQATGCPENTYGCNSFGCPNTCYCQDHCSWDTCVLTEGPKNCLKDTNGAWHWNSNYWEAKDLGRYPIRSIKHLLISLYHQIMSLPSG